ncbi:MAG: hypothetical protein M1274_12070 [Actinobacteria bacterium]|nr:hypothetical protein [Actinomycetota bacterium]
MVHEPAEEGLESFPAISAEKTTKLLVPPDVRYLAVWRIQAPGWDRIRRVAAAAETAEGFVYVPAFSLMRPVVQQLGVALSLAQPSLELARGLPAQAVSRPSLVGAQEGPGSTLEGPSLLEGPAFGAVSPILVSRQDARMLAQFVHLAVESHEMHDLHPVEADLVLEGEELVFIPAVWDTRYIHESNWRLLLSEFDDLVA